MKRVLKALGDENEMVRAAAAQTLGRIGDPKAVDPLVIALGDRLGIVRYAAAMALKKMPPDFGTGLFRESIVH